MAEMSARTDQARTLLEVATDEARQVRREGFRALLGGKSVTVEELSSRSGLGIDEIRLALSELESKGLARVDVAGRLVGAAGLSVVPSPHRLELDGRVFHTWCALDAVGIPAALEADARATTTCPQCGRTMEVDIRGGCPVNFPEAVIWLPSKSCSSVADELCPDMNLFCDERHLREWSSQSGDPAGQSLSLREAADLGREWWT